LLRGVKGAMKKMAGKMYLFIQRLDELFRYTAVIFAPDSSKKRTSRMSGWFAANVSLQRVSASAPLGLEEGLAILPGDDQYVQGG
jgi:hypothetical protein